MDLRMPHMDGYEATEALKSDEKTKNIPVVALTASAFKKDVERISAIGFDAYLRKPISKAGLLNELALFIDHEEISEGIQDEKYDYDLSPDISDSDKKVLHKIKNDYLAECESLKKTVIVGKVNDFVFMMDELARQHDFEWLKQWSSAVTVHVNSYNITEIKKCFQDLETLVHNQTK